MVEPNKKRIKELRKLMGLTQERFAAQLGVTVSTVNRWENGKGKPSPLALLRIKEFWQEIEKQKNANKNGI